MAIANALARLAPEASILLATSADEVARGGLLPQVEIFKLPGLRKMRNGHYVSRRLPLTDKVSRSLRSRLLTALVDGYRPDVLLADKHPFGAGGELREGLKWHRSHGGRTALGFRDILDEPETVLAEWEVHGVADTIATCYDRLLVYGQPSVFDPVTAYRLPEGVRKRTCYCGYVVHETSGGRDDVAPGGRKGRRRTPRQRVLATVGGGEDGGFLLGCFLRAARGTDWQADVVTGPMLPSPEQHHLRTLAAEVGATIHQHLPNLRSLFRRVDVVVCMGGYNTLAETVAAGAKVLCIPRVHPRREQLLRAEAFERLGLLRCLRPDDVTPGRLRAEIARMLSEPSPASRGELGGLSLDGGKKAASALLELAVSRGAAGGETAEHPGDFTETWQI